MKASIARKLVFFAGSLLLVFSLVLLFVFYRMNINLAKSNAQSLLQIFEAQMQENNYDTKQEFRPFVKYAQDGDVRITIISVDGLVLADTLWEEGMEMQNHLSRIEVQQALTGEMGSDIRNSTTFNIHFLYVANVVEVNGLNFVLRVAIAINTANQYLTGTIISIAGAYAAVVLLLYIISGQIANTFLKPYELIKEKLDSVLNPMVQSNPITLTKQDDINAMLMDIDEISEQLNQNLMQARAEKQKLRFIVENLNQAVLALDKEKQVVLCNNTAKTMLNFDVETPFPIKQVLKNANMWGCIEEATASGKGVSHDISESNGRILRFRVFPISSETISFIIVVQDVTDIRKLSKEKQEFFENAGHELKTPLSSILGYSELLLNKHDYDEIFVETINKEAQRMRKLIADMLKISQLENDKTFDNTVVDLKTVLEAVIESLGVFAESKNIAVTAELEDCKIYADSEKITEVATNIIDNALKYTNPNGWVKVTLKQSSGKAVFAVEDNGVGIPSAGIPRVFERFYRADKGRCKKDGGTGLGLAIVKHICNLYNAKITLKSKVGVGTKVSVGFALHDPSK